VAGAPLQVTWERFCAEAEPWLALGAALGEADAWGGDTGEQLGGLAEEAPRPRGRSSSWLPRTGWSPTVSGRRSSDRSSRPQTPSSS
jgi:hypothetical protein